MKLGRVNVGRRKATFDTEDGAWSAFFQIIADTPQSMNFFSTSSSLHRVTFEKASIDL